MQIVYKVLSHTLVYNPKTNAVEQQACFAKFVRDYSEANKEIAKREAYNGEYTIEDAADNPSASFIGYK